jgi:putative ABC transport system permease protein
VAGRQDESGGCLAQRITVKSRTQKNALLLAEIKESFFMAMNAVAAHKLRSSLTLLGILVGVFSIIVVMTAIRVLQQNIEKEMSQLGSSTFQVQLWPAIRVDDGTDSVEKYFRRKKITLATALELKEKATFAKNIGVVAGLGQGEASSRFAKTNPDVNLTGMTPETFETRNLPVEEGRALMPSDIDSARPVGVLGNSLAKRLFPRGSALGEEVKFQGINYKIVGVLESKGSIFGQDQDNFMAIPITTALNRYGRERSVDIQVQAYDQLRYEDTVEQVRGILRAVRKVEPGKDDDFEIVSNDSIIDQFRTLTLAIRTVAAVISSIALVAAGIGIMNIMLVSVTERTREIGVRRAIGAKKRNIMAQFIMEAVVLCEVGGLLGVISGIGAGNVAAYFLKVPPVIPFDWAAIGLGICSLVGIIFGTYPAYKAANLDPIESLRYE